MFVLSPKRPNFFHAATYIIFGLLGLKTSRGIVWFGLVMAPILAEHIACIIKAHRNEIRPTTSSGGSQLLNIIFCWVLFVMGVISLPWFKDRLPLPQAKAGLISYETPVQATKVLMEEKPPGELFNAISFGSYLIRTAHPKYQVFVDSRIELFPMNVWRDYLNISNAIGDWDSRLEDYGVNTLTLSPDEQPLLIEAVQDSGTWKLLYKDNSAYLFERN